MRGLYAIVDVDSLERRGLDPVRFASAVLTAKPAALQLRAKGALPRQVLGLLRELKCACRRAGVPLVANDRADLAALVGCDMVHVGQTDATVEQVRRIAPGVGVGISTHDLGQLEAALSERSAYVAYGPVFPTASKANPEPAVGLDGLAQAAQLARGRAPLVAIGGIGLEQAESIARLADAAAVIAALLPPEGAQDPYAAVAARAAALHARLGGARASSLEATA
jgi:thiamine-phosphate pyrophosphorylase